MYAQQGSLQNSKNFGSWGPDTNGNVRKKNKNSPITVKMELREENVLMLYFKGNAVFD